ncbi:MAG: multicomponent Na+:H+ antiporter subunit G [Dinoroseobacter sp.]|jgi:multicomponent Na+:H+ antiporter subunit G
MTWIDWIAVVLMVGGGFFTLIAGLGVLRMQDVFIRMHASTKAGTLGVGMICGAVALEMGGETAVKAVAVIFFILFTAPIGAHLIARAAWRARVPLWQQDGQAPARPDFICEDEAR